MNAQEVIEHLKCYFAAPAYCLLEQVSQLKYRVQRIESAVKACDDIRNMLAQVQKLADLNAEIQESIA